LSLASPLRRQRDFITNHVVISGDENGTGTLGWKFHFNSTKEQSEEEIQILGDANMPGKPSRKRSDENRLFERTVADISHASATTDGRLEIAEAISTTTTKVSVDPTTTPFTTKPDDLFDLTFNDDNVGIDDEDLMKVFKAFLKRRLPSIAQLIEDKIPANPNLEIELVAQFVFAALGSKQ
jgi:hypothetical protein